MIHLQDFAGSAFVVLAQSTILLAGVLVVSRQLQRRGPAATSLLFKAGLVGIIALCALPFVPLHRNRSLVTVPNPPQVAIFSPSSIQNPADVKPIETSEVNHTAASAVSSTSVGGDTPAPAEPVRSSNLIPDSSAGDPIPVTKLTWPEVILGIWSIGTAVLLLWIVWAQAQIATIRRRAVLVTEGLANDQLLALSQIRQLPMPELRIHPDATSPFLVGILRPAIIADGSVIQGLDSASLDMIFEHELAHLRTKDCAWRLIERIACALLWPQPLLWMLCKRLDHSSEELCDLYVVANSQSRKQYADCLLALANGKPYNHSAQALAVGVVPFRSAIGRRIAKILDASQRISTRLSVRSHFGIAGITSILAIAAALAITGGVQSKQVQIQPIQFGKGSDPQAVELFQQVREAYMGLDSFSVTVKASHAGHVSGIFKLDYKRPGKAFVTMMGHDVLTPRRYLYVGPDCITSTWPGNPKVYEVSRRPTKPNAPYWGLSRTGIGAMQHVAGMSSSMLAQFLEDMTLPKDFNAGKLALGPDKVMNGQNVASLVLEPSRSSTGGIWDAVITFFVRKDDHLLEGWSVTQHQRGSSDVSSSSEDFEDIKANPSLDDKEFVFQPRAGMMEVAPDTGPTTPSPEVQKLLDKVKAAYRSLKSLNFEAKDDRGRLTVSLAKPNLLRMSVKMNWDGREHEYLNSVCDGKTEYVWQTSKSKTYKSQPAEWYSIGNFNGAGMPMNVFQMLLSSVGWGLNRMPDHLFWGSLKLMGGNHQLGTPSEFKGLPVDVVVATATSHDEYGTPLPESYSQTIYCFGKKDHLLYRVLTHNHNSMGGKVFDHLDTNYVTKLDTTVKPASTFVFHPGKMTSVDSLAKMDRIYDPELNTPISVGESFPNIDSVDLQGKSFSLDQYRGKVVLVYAWTLGVENTDTDLPKIEACYRKYRDQGFVPVGIACDGKTTDEGFLKSKGIEGRTLLFKGGLDKKLRIHLFPCSYIIGRDGKVFAKNPWIPDVEPLLKQALGAKP